MKKLPVRVLLLGALLACATAFATYKKLKQQINPPTTIEVLWVEAG
jgi:hypothetical protein